MTVREAVFQWLKERKVDRVFGNPGSTELSFLVDFPKEIQYVLALQESVATAMADGYAQMTGRPAFLNLHVAPGVGNAIGAMFNALKNKSPLVVTTGQQDTRHILNEPFLSGDLVGLARPVCKHAYEVLNPSDTAPALELAYRIANTPPKGPAFVSIPVNYWTMQGDPATVRQEHASSAADGLDRVAEALNSAVKPALVLGAQCDEPEGWEASIALAEKLGCAVFSAPLASRMAFPTNHPLYRGTLIPAAPRLLQVLAEFDLVLAVGCPVFLVYPYFPGKLIPPGCRAIQITDDPTEATKTVASETLMGDPVQSLVELAALVEDKKPALPSKAVETAKLRSEAMRAKPTMGVSYAMYALSKNLPDGATVFDESISSTLQLKSHIASVGPKQYFTVASGGLGWGMPASIGAKLAEPDRPVVCAIGDGSCMYSIQALWTAAQQRAGVFYYAINNSGYSILKSFTKAFYPGAEGTVPGLEIPQLDLVALAKSMGVEAARVSDPEGLEAAIQRGLAYGGPYLLDVMVDPTVPNLF
ncbi:MAG: benzoylformate decarboxylase [Armatimonadetes bacterium]|nr:benzoylformate decarboxylase [Armatimonadota bacterium]